ncbi:MAG: DNA gyrase inhibitor YacG [Gammaproteobacteria bacterium]|nr:DNA gyrase inhibitor YacG [Gammaproteobacteria bacterium]
MSDELLEVACPTCGKSVTWNAEARWRPFCSERCRLIDLGEWLSEENRIPGDPATSDINEQ